MFFTESFFFGESLHRKFMTIQDALNEIDGSEVSSAYFLDGFELLMKAYLVKVRLQNILPQLTISFNQLKGSR